MAKKSALRSCLGVLQSVLVAAVLYTVLYVSVIVIQRGTLPKSPTELIKNPVDTAPGSSPVHGGGESAGTALPPHVKVEKINPHANWFNRPESLVVPNDDYMGKRPHIDTVANVTLLVEQCRGSYEHLEKMAHVDDCMRYLAEGEKEYYYLPPSDKRASAQSPKNAEYLNADGHDNSLDAYPSYKAATKTSIGQCNGPIVPYHVYWTGPATWRVEIFIKSYLYTQNLPCSRLFLWLDGDREPDAVERMLNTDPLFAKFLPFVERGDITLKLWKFPSRIPLPPGDNTDGVGYYKTPGKPNAAGEVVVADGLIRDAEGQEWLVLSETQKTFLPVAVSDAVRFIVLHMYGGAYFDMDVLMLRDMRPFVIGEDHSWAERWGGHPSPGDYNTAIMSLTANSSLSSYLLRGGVRMGLNFHPRIIGVMAVKDHRNFEFHMLETSVFDPIWTEFDLQRVGKCTVPCFRNYGQAFKSKDAFPNDDEWESYDGPQLKPASSGGLASFFWPSQRSPADHSEARDVDVAERSEPKALSTDSVVYDRESLAKMEYKIEEDKYPPTNRTLENFFRGAWTYHIHNQWHKNPEPSSWFNVIQRAQDGFFSDGRTNPYGEKWNGPAISRYEVSWEFL